MGSWAYRGRRCVSSCLVTSRGSPHGPESCPRAPPHRPHRRPQPLPQCGAAPRHQLGSGGKRAARGRGGRGVGGPRFLHRSVLPPFLAHPYTPPDRGQAGPRQSRWQQPQLCTQGLTNCCHARHTPVPTSATLRQHAARPRGPGLDLTPAAHRGQAPLGPLGATLLALPRGWRGRLHTPRSRWGQTQQAGLGPKGTVVHTSVPRHEGGR